MSDKPNTCLHCGKPCEGMYCSASHKVMYHRKLKGAGSKQVNTPAPSKQVSKPSQAKAVKAVVKPGNKPVSFGEAIDELGVIGGGAKSIPIFSPPKPEKKIPDIKGRWWTGPRQWPEMGREEIVTRLKRMREYKDWAISVNLPRMVVSRAEVENLILQAGGDMRLADIVIPLTEYPQPGDHFVPKEARIKAAVLVTKPAHKPQPIDPDLPE